MITEPETASDAPSPTVELCKWVESLTWDDVPEEIRTRAKYLILDGITCAIVASHLPWSETAVKAVSSIEGEGPCHVIGWKDLKVGPLQSALLNSTFIQGFELDDYHSFAPLHSNSIMVPAILALVSYGKHKGISYSGKDFLLAHVVGFEVGPRVGLALHGGEILNRGWHSGPVFGHAASAAASSKFLGLNSEQIEDAFGIACTQTCGLMSAQFESSVKRMQHGFASRNGLFAALMAEQSYKGIKRVFEREYGGFLNVFSLGAEPPVVEELTKDLSEKWITPEINIKPYACMAGIHSTIDALYELFDKKPLQNAMDVVKQVTIEISEPLFKHGGWKATKPLTVIGAQMNNAYICAVILLDGVLTVKNFSEKLMNRPEIWELMEKIDVVHNKEFDTLPRTDRMIAAVKIEFTDGTIKTNTVVRPSGVKAPLSGDEIVDKFRTHTKGLISDEAQANILKTVLEIESSKDVSELVDALNIDILDPLK
ncbi:hypothetical protein AWJ20_2241 [Sugiyamaella lignohabitans]|uniref:Uncharacterized protein n=1 Tax=Sugiyamaella lignohabitans TaxID=796027 RepID=A0A167EZE7_9ASCO|nr:uncharacterized protein AWJ20_2241 [Sugiyamaella lignohabitans]ANB14636.1 hypothetical protein AWJ20_2241 [Sugiyamaella lignohabitans]